MLLALLAAACGGEPPATLPASGEEGASPASAENAAPTPMAANSAPRIERIRLEPERPTAGEAVRVLVEASDPDGDPIFSRYTWRLGGEAAGTGTQKLLLRGASKGQEIEVSVVVSDGKDESEPARVSTRVRNRAPHLLRVSIEPASEIVAGSEIVVRPEARDADGDQVSFRYTWRVNDRRIAEEGPSLATRDRRRGDTVQVEVVATDGEDDSEPLASPKLPIVNASPRIVSQPNQPSGEAGFRYAVKAEDPDGDVRLRFRLEGAPPGMKIDALRGIITWSPAPDQTGKHSVRVIVDDLEGGLGSQAFEVTVGDPGETAPPARVR